jgi:predicted DNA-binding protein (MmcQ/YjbR family)
MTFAKIKKNCLSKKGASEDFPFDNETLVIKAGPKIFALMNIKSKPLSVNLKCEPFLAMELRDRYKAVVPGYHMNKVHWNTVTVDGSIPDKEIMLMVDHSYDLVYKSLPVKEKEKIGKLDS